MSKIGSGSCRSVLHRITIGGVSSSMANAIESLYQSIQARPRPEDVAQLIQELIQDELKTVTNQEVRGRLRKLHTALEPAARNSLKRGASSYSSMAKDFARVVGADKMVATTAKIFMIPDPPSAVECLMVEKVEDFLARISETIGVDPAHVDFKLNRLNREQRGEAGILLNKRPYNHRFRAIRRLKFKLLKMIKNGKKYQATRIAKSAGATKITLEELGRDLHTAYFVAYLAARMSLRSAFTNDSQVRAHDSISEALYQNAKKSGNTNWWAISLVHSQKEVLTKLSDEEKGMLLGTWTETLHMLSDLLRDTYLENNFDLKNMIVRRGNDSSTWNAAAGAWNKARDQWIKLLFDLNMQGLIQFYFPGKVLRLMAADVVYWHTFSKGSLDDSLHPDTKVWRELPHPWEVFSGDATCTREMIELACEVHGVKKEGWALPHDDKCAVEYTPTPELVHGVSVTSPFLASILKSAGAFSGQELKFHVNADVHLSADGKTVVAEPAPAPLGPDFDADLGLAGIFSGIPSAQNIP